jgi:hypothetical protein
MTPQKHVRRIRFVSEKACIKADAIPTAPLHARGSGELHRLP